LLNPTLKSGVKKSEDGVKRAKMGLKRAKAGLKRAKAELIGKKKLSDYIKYFC